MADFDSETADRSRESTRVIEQCRNCSRPSGAVRGEFRNETTAWQNAFRQRAPGVQLP